MEIFSNKTVKILTFVSLIIISILNLNPLTARAVSTKTIELGTTRVETAMNIEQFAIDKYAYDYGGSRSSAVLVSWNDNTDGIAATGLGYPVFYNKSGATTITDTDLRNRLKKFSKIYVIGGKDVMPETVVNDLKSLKSSITVERLEGTSRYETSVEIAEKMKSNGRLNGILLVQSSTDNNKVSSLLVGIAARKGYAILYNDSTTVNTSVKDFINSAGKTVYAIGNVSTSGITATITKITGSNIYKLNQNLISKFGSYSNVILIPNAIDAVPTGYLAKVTGASIMLADTTNTSNYNIASMKSSTISIYSICSTTYSQPIINALIGSASSGSASSGSASSGSVSTENSKNKVVFYISHQDDETLYMGQIILKAIEKVGKNNVYTVLISDGAASYIQNDTTIKNRLSQAGITFSKGRDQEYYYACQELGIPTKNILFAEDINLTRESDSKVNKNNVKKFIEYFENKFSGNVIHMTYSYIHDTHNDNKALGQALFELYKANTSKYSERVYFITRSDQTWDIPSNYLKTVSETRYTNLNLTKIYKALKIYETVNYSKGLVGIGAAAGGSEMNRIKNTINNGNTLTTQVHLPYTPASGSSSDIKVTSVKITTTTATINIKETTTLTATVSPKNATNKTVTWSTSKKEVATVNSYGIVTGISEGTATITAKSNNGIESTCTVTVQNPNVAVTKVSLDKTSATISKGGKTTLTATVSPMNATNTEVTWTTSDKSVATVDNNGKVKGIKVGTATITAKSNNGIEAKCKVKVEQAYGGEWNAKRSDKNRIIGTFKSNITNRTFTVYDQEKIANTHGNSWYGYCNRAASMSIASGYAKDVEISTGVAKMVNIVKAYAGAGYPVGHNYFKNKFKLKMEEGTKRTNYVSALGAKLKEGYTAILRIDKQNYYGKNYYDLNGDGKTERIKWASKGHWLAILGYRINNNGKEEIFVSDSAHDGTGWRLIDEFTVYGGKEIQYLYYFNK